MAAKITPATRVFRYEGTEIPDPLPNATPQRCLQVLQTSYPKFANAILEGPSLEGGRQIYVIKVAVGTKG